MEKQQSPKNSLNNKYTKWLVIAALALLAIFKWPEIIHDRKNISSIKEGRLEYTSKWWRIDRWHATPWGARHLWNRVNNPKDIPGTDDYGLVNYGQYQKKWGLKTGVEKEYIVKKNMTKEEKESVSLAIFLEVSRQFEEHQWMTDFITGSSYDAADMFSNIVWFYRAVREYPEDEVREYLDPVGVDSSLVIYEQKGIGKNKKIGTIIKKEEEDEISERYPYPFNQIRTVRKGKYYNNRWILFKDKPATQPSEYLSFVWYSPTGFDMFSVNKEYETQVSESKVKQWLSTNNPDLYKDVKVVITNKKTHREVIAYK